MAVGESHVVFIELPTLQREWVLNRGYGEEGSNVEVDDDVLIYNQKTVLSVRKLQFSRHRAETKKSSTFRVEKLVELKI
jgi:hypothetical protein